METHCYVTARTFWLQWLLGLSGLNSCWRPLRPKCHVVIHLLLCSALPLEGPQCGSVIVISGHFNFLKVYILQNFHFQYCGFHIFLFAVVGHSTTCFHWYQNFHWRNSRLWTAAAQWKRQTFSLRWCERQSVWSSHRSFNSALKCIQYDFSQSGGAYLSSSPPSPPSPVYPLSNPLCSFSSKPVQQGTCMYIWWRFCRKWWVHQVYNPT